MGYSSGGFVNTGTQNRSRTADREILRSVTGEHKGLLPGARAILSIDSENARFFLPKKISVACFAAANRALVSVPLMRIPILLRSAMVEGCPQFLSNRGLGVVGIPDEEVGPEDDSRPDAEDLDGYVFRHITPIPVDWSVFGWKDSGRHLELAFENFCERTVHLFVRVDGEPHSSLSGH